MEEDSSGNEIVIRREQMVDFYGDPIPVAQDETDKLWVPVKQIAGFLGLSYSVQAGSPAAFVYIHGDHLGSVSVTMNCDGTLDQD